jgi:hypothetical protein
MSVDAVRDPEPSSCAGINITEMFLGVDPAKPA